MTKAVLFDVDGLVITGEKERFSDRYSKEYKVPIDDVSEFFTGRLKECSFGRADLKEELKPYLEKWKWEGTVEDFIKYWFEADSKINQGVIDIVSKLRDEGIKCFLAARQEKYRASYLLNNLNLKDSFDGMFCTCEIGHDKNESGFWDVVVKELGVKPEEILFFDDSQKNVDFAKGYGIKAYFYSGIDMLKDTIGSHTDQ